MKKARGNRNGKPMKQKPKQREEKKKLNIKKRWDHLLSVNAKHWIKCNWSVRELRRQIKTNLYVRAGISKKPEILIQPSEDNRNITAITIKDPFTFEFLGLDAKEAVSESDLEQALIDYLQEFMLELGEGFCFEERQKRIVIDDKYYFIDLVFYNRLLHCGKSSTSIRHV